eukprot:TRINITY_DN10788_c0_g1_i1.p1 TRINITY_DN10788_c0_g1~~TRINITY_DN10788_c0_g1_i1.p1  ORF type:complete len:180 (-),score=58.11 TRINITY_DN10788_c0_g1_i1:43-582(-)
MSDAQNAKELWKLTTSQLKAMISNRIPFGPKPDSAELEEILKEENEKSMLLKIGYDLAIDEETEEESDLESYDLENAMASLVAHTGFNPEDEDPQMVSILDRYFDKKKGIYEWKVEWSDGSITWEEEEAFDQEGEKNMVYTSYEMLYPRDEAKSDKKRQRDDDEDDLPSFLKNKPRLMP